MKQELNSKSVLSGSTCTSALPADVQRKLEEGEQDYREWIRKHELATPKRGRPRGSVEYKTPVVYTGETQAEIDDQFARLSRALGPKGKGNSRHGRQFFYKQLLDVFQGLRHLGVTLPRNGSLSAEAVLHGVGQILIDHGYTRHSVAGLCRNSTERYRLGHALRNVFGRVADEAER
jgi:hypothetical protein